MVLNLTLVVFASTAALNAQPVGNCRARVIAGADLTRSGDGGPATQARMFTPRGIAEDGRGNLYSADAGHNRVRV